MRNEPWIVDRTPARTASSHAVAIVGLHLCGGVQPRSVGSVGTAARRAARLTDERQREVARKLDDLARGALKERTGTQRARKRKGAE